MDHETDDDGPDFEVVPVLSPLRDKVAMRAEANPDSMFEAADNAIAEQARSYLDRARAELEEATGLIAAAMADDGRRVAALDRLYGIIHDMKGQAAKFGYPLTTNIAALLCRLLSNRPALDAAALKVVEAHVNGLSIVMKTGLAGDSGELGRRLLERLRALGAPFTAG